MRSPFVVNVADLATPGSQRRDQLAVPVDWALDLSRIEPDPPLSAELVLQSVSGGLLVTGRVRAAVRHTCHRCLIEFVEPHDVAISSLFMAEPDDESYLLDGDEVDLEQMLRDEVLLAMPLLPRCGPSCPGVVSSPGTDLNTIAAGDDEDVSASPFAVLRDLLDSGT